MNKSLLAAELRGHFLAQGANPSDVSRMSDDAIIEKIVAKCGWCGARHIRREQVDTMIVASLDQQQFQSLANDLNGSACPQCQ
jgi:hypothetical protein